MCLSVERRQTFGMYRFCQSRGPSKNWCDKDLSVWASNSEKKYNASMFFQWHRSLKPDIWYPGIQGQYDILFGDRSPILFKICNDNNGMRMKISTIVNWRKKLCYVKCILAWPFSPYDSTFTCDVIYFGQKFGSHKGLLSWSVYDRNIIDPLEGS